MVNFLSVLVHKIVASMECFYSFLCMTFVCDLSERTIYENYCGVQKTETAMKYLGPENCESVERFLKKLKRKIFV